MAYTPTEWVTGDVITAVKLNNMEQGIEDAFVAPAVTIADEGDVLTVNSSGAWAAAAPASQLPAVTAADQGKVLTVDSSGDWDAAAPATSRPVIFTGNLVINSSSYTGEFTLTSNNLSDLSQLDTLQKDGKIIATISFDMGGDDPIEVGVYNIPFDGIVEIMESHNYMFKKSGTVATFSEIMCISVYYDGAQWTVQIDLAAPAT